MLVAMREAMEQKPTLALSKKKEEEKVESEKPKG